MDGHMYTNVIIGGFLLSLTIRIHLVRTDGRMDGIIISDRSIMASPYPRDWLNAENISFYQHNGDFCQPCLIHEDWMRELARSAHLTPHEFDKMYDTATKKWRRTCPNQHATTSHVGNGAPKGLFAGTLTMSPEWGKTEEDIVSAAQKIFAQKTCPVEKYAWYLESTKDGIPHIHFIYETESKGRIHKKVFKRYWEWGEGVKGQQMGQGWKGGYHKPVESEIAYQEYIAKDAGRHDVKGFPV